VAQPDRQAGPVTRSTSPHLFFWCVGPPRHLPPLAINTAVTSVDATRDSAALPLPQRLPNDAAVPPLFPRIPSAFPLTPHRQKRHQAP
jgi:hypothetical protein